MSLRPQLYTAKTNTPDDDDDDEDDNDGADERGRGDMRCRRRRRRSLPKKITKVTVRATHQPAITGMAVMNRGGDAVGDSAGGDAEDDDDNDGGRQG